MISVLKERRINDTSQKNLLENKKLGDSSTENTEKIEELML